MHIIQLTRHLTFFTVLLHNLSHSCYLQALNMQFVDAKHPTVSIQYLSYLPLHPTVWPFYPRSLNILYWSHENTPQPLHSLYDLNKTQKTLSNCIAPNKNIKLINSTKTSNWININKQVHCCT